MFKEARLESEIFSDLETLCTSPGYAHAIAYFCFRDNTISYSDELALEDLLKQYSANRLLRTEISTLIGLMHKKEIDFSLPEPRLLNEYLEKTEKLLLELHHSMMKPVYESFIVDGGKLSEIDPTSKGAALRENIFYGGEAAYDFQYSELSKEKYQKDDGWFVKNKGYSVHQAHNILSAVSDLQNDKINDHLYSLKDSPPADWTMLPAFEVSVEEVSERSTEEKTVVQSLLDSFLKPDEVSYSVFSALSEFNPYNAYPIIRTDGGYLIYQNYSLLEAFYETPFFWFMGDKGYKNAAIKNRGDFTEEFSERRLRDVFGEGGVYTNINIYEKKSETLGEIDVLVVFGDRAIILQAKSKKLTIEARKGNDNCLRDDFKKAVQSAYDQALDCSRLLRDKKYKLEDSNGNEINIKREFSEIYPFCVVSDHYPALNAQARSFLKYEEDKVIKPPYVMDVFFLDVLSEMLDNPLYFLSYVNRRVNYLGKVNSNHELTVLSYHLKNNLWIEDGFDMIAMEDNVSADLELSMMARRKGLPGPKEPGGLLTAFNNTYFEDLINNINNSERPGVIDFGFFLLTIDGHSIAQLNDGIKQLIDATLRDGKHHDLTVGFSSANSGITIHCNNDNDLVASARLEEHCVKRKYSLKADKWFGICIDPQDQSIRFGLSYCFDWEQSKEMDRRTENMPGSRNVKAKGSINFKTHVRPMRKLGRNEKCYCGSGKKYKKCCL